jgi:hypothetical protein
MVEAHDSNEEEAAANKTFIEVPAILDQLKAASVITNGKYLSIQEPTPLHSVVFYSPTDFVSGAFLFPTSQTNCR